MRPMLTDALVAAGTLLLVLGARFTLLRVLSWRVYRRWLSNYALRQGLERRPWESNAALRKRVEMSLSMRPGARLFVAAERISKGDAIVIDMYGQARRAR